MAIKFDKILGTLRELDSGDGATGPQGPAGTDGEGVPTGGTTGQVLAKINATDFNTEWVDQPDNVTLVGTPDYITISGQVITRNEIDLTTDTNTKITVGTTAPGSPATNDLWIDTN